MPYIYSNSGVVQREREGLGLAINPHQDPGVPQRLYVAGKPACFSCTTRLHISSDHIG